MVDSKENYIFDLGVKGLNIQTVQQDNKQFLIRSEKICSNRWPQSMELTHANRDYFMDRANEKNFHSQVVMHNRNKQVSTANEWEFSKHCIKRINFVQVVSMVWRFYFIHTEILSHWPTLSQDWKPFLALTYEELSFVSLIGWTIYFHSCSFSMQEINMVLRTRLNEEWLSQTSSVTMPLRTAQLQYIYPFKL